MPHDLAPLVSVVIPCKDRAHYLVPTIESVLSQDYPRIECIVGDGGSSDETREILASYGEAIKWFSQEDRGPFDAINRGWKESQGDILTWLNADDLLEKGAVRQAVETFVARPEVDVVYGTCGVIDEQGSLKFYLEPANWDLRTAVLYCDHIIFQPASFMRRQVLEKVGWLYPAWNHDHDLWLRLAVAGARFERLPVSLAYARDHPFNAGFMPHLFVDGKVGLTRRFFQRSDCPPELRGLKRRAISNAYLRCWDYLDPKKPRHWLVAVRLGFMAFVAEPRNSGYIARRGTRTAAQHLPPLRTLASLIGSLKSFVQTRYASVRGIMRRTRAGAKVVAGHSVLAIVAAMVVAGLAVAGALDDSVRSVRDDVYAAAIPLLLIAIWARIRTGNR